jgi:isopenicillin N synthase-like dioxygenase
MALETIPTIDLTDPDAASLVRRACTEWGFFYVTSHGVPSETVRRTYEMSRRFFALTEAEKRTVLVNDKSRGFTPMCEETLDPAIQKGGDTKEGFYIGREPSASEIASHSHPLLGGNRWPDEDRFGSLVGWRVQMQSYFAEMSRLGHSLLRLVAMALDLEADYFLPFFDRSMEVLRLLHYSDTVSDPDAGIFGAGAHSDYGMLTILSTDSSPGLEVYRHDLKRWFPVPPLDGAFVINLGDMLQVRQLITPLQANTRSSLIYTRATPTTTATSTRTAHAQQPSATRPLRWRCRTYDRIGLERC